ncbi:hypothetical protein [Labedaea rhizosphaerae]|uniref:Hydrolytic protein n=1 Tax=Labedaea rhizosphaerae TaxID=598644 RepID=A0A4R6SGL2_LABRH|nr:hypothetical protein [Labedaea rhizosphaerae]TDQ00783.1 hypothetical protein EV186_102649 [Labedaea rhizosphaerae]
MAVSATLRTTEVRVAPGAGARCHVLVRNSSAVVDQFVFAVRGDVADWTQIKPARVNLMPQQEVSVELTFMPPRSWEVLAGEHPFALQVSSREDPGGSVVQEGTVTVDPFTELDAVMVPETSNGRRTGRHTIAIDNYGNHSHRAEVSATDPDAKLTFRVRPHAPMLEPGTATLVRIRARPKRYFWKGPERLLPFTAHVVAKDHEPIDVPGAFNQGPLIPRRVYWLIAMLFTLMLMLVLLITFLLRQKPVSIATISPSVTSTPTSTSATPTTTSTRPRPTTTAKPTKPGGGVNNANGNGGGNGSGDDASNRSNTTTFTINSGAYPNVGGGPQLFSYVVPAGPNYRVTSVVLHNPAADTGQVQLRHGNQVLGTYDLAQVHGEFAVQLPDPPLVAPGDRVTMAVSCTNRRGACTPSGQFTAALVR